MLPRLVLPVWGPPAKLLNLQRKHGAVQLAQSSPAPTASNAAVRRQGPMLPTGSQPGRKSVVVCQAVDPEVDSDMDFDQETQLERRLHEAILEDDWEEVAALVTAGAPADLEGGDFDATLLHYAVEAGELGVVKLLLQKGADPDAEGWRGPPLVSALFYEGFKPIPKANIDPAIVRALVAAGANPDMYDIYDPEHFPGYTMMHLAALENTPHIIAILGEMGANTEVRLVLARVMAHGQTPLHVAATNGNVQAVKTLLDWGADVNSPFGADISARDAEGRTALEVAKRDDVKAVLQAATAKI